MSTNKDLTDKAKEDHRSLANTAKKANEITPYNALRGQSSRNCCNDIVNVVDEMFVHNFEVHVHVVNTPNAIIEM